MLIKTVRFTRKVIIFFVSVLFLVSLFYSTLVTRSPGPFVPPTVLRPASTSNSSSFKKVSLAYYTTFYGSRKDSQSNLFNADLNQICTSLDPEEYSNADGVVVSMVDFVRFPVLAEPNESYRRKYASQLWLLHVEESPRNSYRTVETRNVSDLDDWFNLTASLKPESDLHIQYNGYRIKPEIALLLQEKLNVTLNQTRNSTSLPTFPTFPNATSSTYINTLTSVVQRVLVEKVDHIARTCPYTCNQPLPSTLLHRLQPYLKPLPTRTVDRDTIYIAWFVSNCHSHSGREHYVLRLRSQPGIHVDIYGYCASMFHSHIVPIQCQKGSPQCIAKTLRNYRFYLSFENSKCDSYITEKYWTQGVTGETIPIVLGATREQYQRIAVPNSYIHVDDFSTVEELAEELHRLNRNDSAYNHYLQWTQLYDVQGAYGPTGGYDMHSILCFLGHYQRLHAMTESSEQIRYLLQRIRDLFHVGQQRLANFNWQTARTNLIRISDFYNPKVNCWDNEYPSIFRQVYNYLFTWWKLL